MPLEDLGYQTWGSLALNSQGAKICLVAMVCYLLLYYLSKVTHFLTLKHFFTAEKCVTLDKKYNSKIFKVSL